MPKPMPVGVVDSFPKQTSGQATKLTSGQADQRSNVGQTDQWSSYGQIDP